MSISFNHPKDTMTSTDTLNLSVLGGTPANPRPIRLNASSVIVPVRGLPAGEIGSLVLDNSTKTLKYHDGTSWVEILAADVVLSPIYISLQDIYNRLDRKVESVTYSSSAVPTASISGTNLNIVFPLDSGSGTGPTGLFTASKPGCIQFYSLTSGQSAASIREQMSGIAGGQTGRTGTQASPWLTSDGWCFSDGMWWTWNGQNGTVTKQVPNLNTEAYLKTMSVSGITRTSSMISASGSTNSVALTIAQLPPHNFTVSGQTSASGDHVHVFPLTDDKSGTGRADGGNMNRTDGSQTTNPGGNHIHTFQGTTNTIGSGQGHAHTLTSVDVNHYTIAALYNIAESEVALSETVANSRYVLKAGDTMTGQLTIAQAASIRGADTTLSLVFRNASNAERAAITHNSTNNTLRLRSSGGAEVQISSTGGITIPGNATVGGKNVVRSVNGTNADASGNVNISSGIQDVRLGVQVQVTTRNTAMLPSGYVSVGTRSNYNDSNWELDTMYGCPIEKQINNIWYVVTKL